MDPTAYDRWWKKRIEKEEQGFARHLIDPTEGEIRLNTIGGAQLCGSKKNRSIQHQRRNPVSCFRPCNRLNRLSDAGRTAILSSREASVKDFVSTRSALSEMPNPSFPMLQENHCKDGKGGKTRSVGSSKTHTRPPRKPEDCKTAVPKMASCGGSNSVTSYPDTPKFSELTDRTSEVLHRLQNLEQELLKEKLKREVAERQISDLLNKNPK
ncbi:hypothetical protein BSKO_11990 [Bryopsis sp. KO-2023]|nr:hypothetical protein BSKO_11990 [Bryopsis sp. KO-2023]